MARRLNRDRTRARVSRDLTVFVRQYARKAQRNHEPNDRAYDRDVENRVKRMDPLALDRLPREDDAWVREAIWTPIGPPLTLGRSASAAVSAVR